MFTFQSSADGEFSRVKDKHTVYLTRHIDDDTYTDIKDSHSFCEFGNKTMAAPGHRSGIEKRHFLSLSNESIQLRSSEVLLGYIKYRIKSF